MNNLAHLPQPCPNLAHGHGPQTLPTLPHPLRGGHGQEGALTEKKEADQERPCPTERRRLYRRPQTNLAPAQRRGRLSRVQVETLRPHRAEAFVAFNDGVEATAARGPVLDGLQLASRNGAMIDVELADYGNGWLVEQLSPPSDCWQPLRLQDT